MVLKTEKFLLSDQRFPSGAPRTDVDGNAAGKGSFLKNLHSKKSVKQRLRVSLHVIALQTQRSASRGGGRAGRGRVSAHARDRPPFWLPRLPSHSPSSRLLLSEPAASRLPHAPRRAPAARDYLLGDEAAGEGGVDFMGEAEGRQQLPSALADGILRGGVTFVAAGELFPFIIGGIWEECKPHASDTFKKLLVEAAARSRGRT